jgi:hypothetical protein
MIEDREGAKEQWKQAYAASRQGGTLPEGFYTQEAMWHQLVAVAAIIQGFFSGTYDPEPSSPEGMAIIDEVGLGKTLEVILTIAFLIGLVDGRSTKKADPPILGMSFFIQEAHSSSTNPQTTACSWFAISFPP